MQMLTPNVDDHVHLGVDCNPDVALLVPALVESEIPFLNDGKCYKMFKSIN